MTYVKRETNSCQKSIFALRIIIKKENEVRDNS